MSMYARFVGLRALLTGLGGQEPAERFQRASGAVSGPVTIASQQPKPDGAELLRQREMWARLGEKARQNRQSRQASICEAHCRDVTTDILRGRK